MGVHPHAAGEFGPAELAALRALAGQPKVVAIGEIGLDYYHDFAPRARQMQAFRAQLALAAELGLPVIVHNREATGDVLAVLRDWQSQGSSLQGRVGVLHSFSATVREAEIALEMGFYLGITGPVTYKNGEEMRRVAAAAPLERLLIETDAPYLAPQRWRGQRNEPAYVGAVAERIAAVRGLAPEEVARATSANAAALFRWERPS